jgi:hypothetical protein
MWTTLIFSGTAAIFLAMTFVTLRQDGVRWRDTFYSIDALRAGGVR